MINLSRKNQPEYLFRLNVALVCFFVFWFTAGTAVMVTTGCIYGESVITYAVMGGVFALFFIGLAAFWLADNKLHKRLIDERTAELEREFCDMPFEEAERILKEKGIITDTSFVANADGVSGKEVVPFEKARLIFNINTISEVRLEIRMYDTDGGTRKATYDFDKAMYNYISAAETNLKDNASICFCGITRESLPKIFCPIPKFFSGSLINSDCFNARKKV